MRRFAPIIIALAVLLSVVGMRAPSAEAHAAFNATWSYYTWTWYGQTYCSADTRMLQPRAQVQTWRYYDYNHGFWINHHNHTISSWTTQVGWCTGGA